MNTRSSTTGRKCSMTVECSSHRSENHYIGSGRQTKLKNNRSKEISKFENDLKTKTGVDGEDQPKRKRQDIHVKEDCGVTTRSNGRPAKRAKTQTPERLLNLTPESSKAGNKRLGKTGCKGKKRQWESWAPNEKDCFFEALCEHGKDFDKIHTYLGNVYKRRGDLSAAVRNKDQVRHFYYRTLNKISKYIPEPQDPSDAKKTHHEVRSLICYGELRKKFRSLKEKDGKKLTELISTGKTTFRHHGRNVNIRAPTCRALKKLNTNEEQEQIPPKIMIELIPGENKTWSTIQGLAHNPRLRTNVSTRKTVCSLIAFLLSKWKLQDNANISLSPYSLHPSKPVGNKSNDNEAVPKVKQGYEGNKETVTSEGASKTTESPADGVRKTASTVNVEASSSVKAASNATPQDDNLSGAKEREPSAGSDVQTTWNKLNSGNLTIADIYRRMNSPRKILLKYSLNETPNERSSNHALEQLVKLASGEFIFKNKKESVNISSSKPAKDTSVVSKANKATKPKSTPKPPKPLAPKPPPDVVIPTVVSASVINQVSTNSSTKSGNHLTFGFTPINSFPRPSPFLPKQRKRQASRVVVQRTLLPRLNTGVVSPPGRGPPVSFVQSPTQLQGKQNGLVNSRRVNKQRIERKILPKETNVRNGETQARNGEPSSCTLPPSAATLTVDSLINIAMSQELPEHLETLILSKSLNMCKSPSENDHVHTEEIDSGVAGQPLKSVKEVQNLNEAIKHLENTKHDVVEHSVDLMDNLKSSEDEDPFKFLSPSHLPNFPPETWLNEESTDFSLGTLFANLETSPVKQKPSNVLDTPKKSGAGSDSDSKYSHAAPMFCDMVDENSVDYVKKFRDLAKKMGNDQESSSSDNPEAGPSSALSFKSLLLEASKDTVKNDET